MAQIEYITSLNDMYQSQGFPPYQWSEFETSPWTPVSKPLAEMVVSLISSAGISRDNQEPFDPWAVNDLSFRQIPIDTPFEQLTLRHNYFDHRDAVTDLNCVFPTRRLSELAAEGIIGKLAPTAVTLGMGRLYKRTALQNETVPRIVEILKREQADAVLLVPA
ncbi:MAG: glycine/sarcosine/betaine reductase selenoprotein B family protein [bacterium]